MTPRHLLALVLAGLVACEDSESIREGDADANVDVDVDVDVGGIARVEAPSHDVAAGPPLERTRLAAGRPPRVMPSARQAFDEVVALIDAHYVDGQLPTDALWTAAAEGVLQRLIAVEGADVNTLMSPRELEELQVGTQGQVVGVGVMIEMIADVVVVRGVVPGGAAEHAELAPGDRILRVNGERLRGVPLAAVVDRIRGAEGTSVSLFVQRDTEEWEVELTRSRIAYSSVRSKLAEPKIGYLRIDSLATSTAADVETQLRGLIEQGMTAFVLDLRACPGGLLDASIAVTELFLAPGLRVMESRGPEHGDHVIEATVKNDWESIPMIALIGAHTASGGEILAAALQANERARLIGERTMGKGTVEAIHELRNGWALKLSMSRFFSPDGEPILHRGVVPDIEIRTESAPPHPPHDELDPSHDPVLAAALNLLRE